MKYASLASSSSGNSHYISYKGYNLLVDCGLSLRYISNSLNQISVSPEDLDAVLITHDHVDHIAGLAKIQELTNCDVYIPKLCYEANREKLSKIPIRKLRLIFDDGIFFAGDLKVKPIRLSHDASESYGYFLGEEKVIGIITDLGYFSAEMTAGIKNVDVLILEANYDEEMLKIGPYPPALKRRISAKTGHLSNRDSGQAAVYMAKNHGTKMIYLAHLSEHNNHPDIAFEEVRSILNAEGFSSVGLEVLLPKKVSAYIEF